VVCIAERHSTASVHRKIKKSSEKL
jgi:hypothetical protein